MKCCQKINQIKPKRHLDIIQHQHGGHPGSVVFPSIVPKVCDGHCSVVKHHRSGTYLKVHGSN